MVIILELNVIKSADQVAGKIGDPVPYAEGIFQTAIGEVFICSITVYTTLNTYIFLCRY